MRHRKGLGPGLKHERFYEGNIGGRGSDSGTAGGDTGNYDSDGSGSGGSSRDSSRFNSGGGGGGGGGGFDPVETIRETASDIGGAASNAANTVTSPVTDTVSSTVDFVRSGPDEASVGDDNFGDETISTGGDTVPDPTGGNDTGGNQTVDPDRPTTGVNQTIVDESTSSGGFVAENRTDTSAVLPGEIAGIDISENRLEGVAEAGESFNERITAGTNATASPQANVGLNNPVLDDAAGNTVEALAGLPQAAESTAEFGQNAPLNTETAQTVGSTAVGAARSTGQQAISDPAGFTAEVGFGAAIGSPATRAASRFRSSGAGSATPDSQPIRGRPTADGGLVGRSPGDTVDIDADFGTQPADINTQRLISSDNPRLTAGQLGRQRAFDREIEAGRRQNPPEDRPSPSQPDRDISSTGPDAADIRSPSPQGQRGPQATTQSRTFNTPDNDLSPLETQLAAQQGQRTAGLDLRLIDDLDTAGGAAAGGGVSASVGPAAGLGGLSAINNPSGIGATEDISGFEDTTLGAGTGAGVGAALGVNDATDIGADNFLDDAAGADGRTDIGIDSGVDTGVGGDTTTATNTASATDETLAQFLTVSGSARTGTRPGKGSATRSTTGTTSTLDEPTRSTTTTRAATRPTRTGTRPNRRPRELPELEEDDESDDEAPPVFDLQADGDLFDSGILSGDEALDRL